MKEPRPTAAASRPTSERAERLKDMIRPYADRPGALLPLLHAIQAEQGFIADDDVPVIADMLNLSRAEVHGTLTFYHDFRRVPAGRHVVRLCGAEACQARGATALLRLTRDRLGIGAGETTADGAVTLETVYCLGLCSVGPAAMVDGRLHARLDTARVGELLTGAA
jgi:formate dehydrogenase subunit gamma